MFHMYLTSDGTTECASVSLSSLAVRSKLGVGEVGEERVSGKSNSPMNESPCRCYVIRSRAGCESLRLNLLPVRVALVKIKRTTIASNYFTIPPSIKDAAGTVTTTVYYFAA
ncbi:hypothetical protein J6590_035476 [Homalodisca vitripennis]|nr:hypothetical protein J6590_035476 [Homalodisca vitripennis]